MWYGKRFNILLDSPQKVLVMTRLTESDAVLQVWELVPVTAPGTF